jgi:hypothetical protein
MTGRALIADAGVAADDTAHARRALDDTAALSRAILAPAYADRLASWRKLLDHDGRVGRTADR